MLIGGHGDQKAKESKVTILRALEKGVNWIDTAPIYGLGRSEEAVGKAIKELHDKPIIATKCGRVWDKNENIYDCLKKESIRYQVEASLRRLKIDVIDLYQIHWPIPDEEIEEAWDTMADLVKEGKVRYGGVSNFGIERLRRIQAIHPVASLQIPYSMLKRRVEDKLFAYCSTNDIGVIVYSPLETGLLTGRFRREHLQDLLKNHPRREEPLFQESKLSAVFELTEGLRPIARKNGRTP